MSRQFTLRKASLFVLIIVITASQSQQVQGSPRSPLLDTVRESRQGASTGIAEFVNGFLTGLTAAFQEGVAGTSALFNGFGSAANNTFARLLSGYNSTTHGIVQGASSFIGNGSRT